MDCDALHDCLGGRPDDEAPDAVEPDDFSQLFDKSEDPAEEE